VIGRPRTLLLGLAVVAAVAGFTALGVWQLERRAWKLDLIARVDARLAAAPVAAPGPEAWPDLSRERAEYTRVRVTGRFLHEHEVAVLAVTDLGSGYWIVTPLETPDFTVLVNRGFVPQGSRDPATRPEDQLQGPVTISGLLRLTEPGGGFLRANDPAGGRWYSRDVAAIARAEDLPGPVAPYFIDAGAVPNPGGLPVGGLTVVRFRNPHLSYALTWFALAAGLALMTIAALRRKS
jgi:surfeit locus 1 family protein